MPGRLAALDTMRLVAFTWVFLHHALAMTTYARWSMVELGFHGVTIFFVLSGYFIGRQLLGLKRAHGPLREALRIFYVRRLMRIVPAYYAVLVLLIVLRHPLRIPLREDALPWHFLFLSNVKIFLEGGWIGAGSHFWSLGVEEQFYLVAPAFLLLSSRRAVAVVCAALVVVVAAARVGIALHPGRWWWPLPFLHADTLGVGLLVALAEDGDERVRLATRRLAPAIALGCGALFVVGVVVRGAWPSPALDALFPTLLAGILAGVIVKAVGDGGEGLRALGSPPLAALGRDTYALYLVHVPVLSALAGVWPELGAPMWTYVATAFLLSAAIARVSGIVLEGPCVRFGHRVTRAAPRG